MSPDLIVFEILIPRTSQYTGLVHPTALLDEWEIQTAERFGGITRLGIGVLGLWYEPPDPTRIEDYSNWYKVGVKPGRIEELRSHAQEAAQRFEQKCIYFEKAGEADFVPPPKKFTNAKPGG
jgi:hypothetical protein